MSKRDEILTKLKDIPALPAVATQILEILRDPDFNMTQLQRSIEHEPSLAANVLKIANSAFYAGSRQIGTIREAIMRLGSGTVKDIVMASSVASVASGPVEGYDLSPGALWEHMVTTALTTNHLAEALGIKLADHAFTAALVHDVGKIALGYAISGYSDDIMHLAFEENVPFQEAERQVLDIDHAEAGAELLKLWRLPEDIITIVRWHHEPHKASVQDENLDIIHFANNLAMMSGLGRGEDGLNYEPSDTVNKYRMKAKKLEMVLTQTMISKEELKAFFGGA